MVNIRDSHSEICDGLIKCVTVKLLKTNHRDTSRFAGFSIGELKRQTGKHLDYGERLFNRFHHLVLLLNG